MQMYIIKGMFSHSSEKISSDEIITGERIQQLANIYIGTQEDFQFNPVIYAQRAKQLDISVLTLAKAWNNPPVVFFYTHRFKQIAQLIHKFKNPVVLLSHNSDENVTDCEESRKILDCPAVIRWGSQNICFKHDKLFLVPIGFANSMWRHGSLRVFDMPHISKQDDNAVFFNFQIATNRAIRTPCFEALQPHYPFLSNVDPVENHRRLQTYKFCISPEGNGVDCHRLWEAFYLRVVPIVLRTPFTEILVSNGLPVFVVDSWESVPRVLPTVKYEDFDFSSIAREFTMESMRKWCN